jgi:putative phage-type endonuclease
MSTENPYTVVEKVSNREAWLEARKQGIGASDVPVILGLSPFKSRNQLYLEKCGMDDEPDEMSEPMKMGLRLEPVIAEIYQEETGRETWGGGELLRSTRNTNMMCTLDRLTRVNASSDPIPLQIKLSGWVAKWSDGLPPDVHAQIQSEMFVYGSTECSLVVLLNGTRMYWDDYSLEPEFIHDLVLPNVNDFMEHVRNKDMPIEIDGSDECRKLLTKLYGEGDEAAVANLGGEFVSYDEEREEIRAKQKALKEAYEAHGNRFREAIGAATLAFLPNGVSYTWKQERQRKAVYCPHCAEMITDEKHHRVLRRKKAK